MQSPQPPSQQQAEEAQRARHAAELAVLGLYGSSANGGGSGDNESSSLDAVRLLAILTALSAAIVRSSFRHPRNSARRVLVSSPDHDRIAQAVLSDSQTAYMRLKASELPEAQQAALWATWAYSALAEQIALAVNAEGLAPPEFLGKELRKVWISRSDRKVRPLHAKLHGKVVPVTGDFWRWPQTGQRLRWPGDQDAPLEAVVGCRCVSLLTWANQDAVSGTIRKIVEHTDPSG